MLYLTYTTGQTAADFPYALGLRHLAEEHCNALFPATVAFGMLLGPVFSNNIVKSVPIYQR